MSEIGLYLKERFEEIVDPIDIDALVAELEEDKGTVTSLAPRPPEHRRALLGAAAAAAVTIIAVGGTLLLLSTGGSGNGVADTQPLPTISDTRAVDIYGAVTESILSEEIARRAENARCRDLPEEGPSNTTPREECLSITLLDALVVYIVDHPVEDVATLEAECSGPDPFDEQPEICDQALTVVHTAPFGSDVKDAIQRAFPDPSVVEFVESAESVTEEVNELPHPLGRGRRIVVDDGALLRLGPIFTDGLVFYLGVRCDGCQGFTFEFLRVEETPSGWLVGDELGPIVF